MSNFLTIIEILSIHADQINRYGGMHGLLDAGALEAAVYRSQCGYYDDVFSEAAALWESLSQNHPFVDGNKRTAFACTYTFLRINGYKIAAEPLETFDFIQRLYNANEFRSDKLADWLRQNAKQLPAP
jgi:death-on-curing protein